MELEYHHQLIAALKYSGPFRRMLLIGILLVPASSSRSYAQEDVRILLDSTAQVIRGFGAANIVGWRPDMTDDEIETAFGTGDGKLGFSILRIRVPPQESQWSINVPTARKAHAMGVKIIASPWSPPAHMKTNGNLVGGQLEDEMFDDYAEYLDSFVAYMAANDAPIYAISVQNEPDIQVNYESCDWTPGDMWRFVRENAESIGTRIIAPESFQFRRQMSDIILSDPAAAANLDIVGGHIYGGGLAPYPLAREKGKELWMTEHLVLETDLEASIGTGVEIQNVMKAGMSAYVWWYIVRYYGPISDGEEGPNAKGEVTKRGHVMAQFSRFIRPGAVRVHADEPAFFSGVSTTAFRDSSTVVLVSVNSSDSPREVTFTIEGGAVASVTPYVTSASQNVEQLDVVPLSDNRFTVSLAAHSVTTFVSSFSAVASDDETAPPLSHHLSPGYPNPFRSAATVEYVVPTTTGVTLEVYDVLGRRIAILVNGIVSPGRHEVTLDGSEWPPGIYFCRLRAGEVVLTRRMMRAR